MNVWVGCLGCYAEGRLVGDWVDAADAGDFVPCDLVGHEEFWVFDTDDMPVSKEMSPYEAVKWAELVDESSQPPLVWAAYVEWTGRGVDEINSNDVDDAFVCFEDEFSEYAEGLLDAHGVPEHIMRYFDWDQWERDLLVSDYVVEDGVVFNAY